MKAFFVFLSIIGIAVFLFWAGYRAVAAIRYDINCGGHLKRAADANTVEMAKVELDVALQYMENNNLKSGFTSILYNTPDEDIGFWYNNIKSARAELDKVNENTTQLERTNILMKLRETLLDSSDGSVSVTAPMGISVYPRNGILVTTCFFSLFVAIIGMIGAVIVWDNY